MLQAEIQDNTIVIRVPIPTEAGVYKNKAGKEKAFLYQSSGFGTESVRLPSGKILPVKLYIGAPEVPQSRPMTEKTVKFEF